LPFKCNLQRYNADLKRMYAKHASFDVTRAFGEDVESEVGLCALESS
jgi:hypothetical protein